MKLGKQFDYLFVGKKEGLSGLLFGVLCDHASTGVKEGFLSKRDSEKNSQTWTTTTLASSAKLLLSWIRKRCWRPWELSDKWLTVETLAIGMFGMGCVPTPDGGKCYEKRWWDLNTWEKQYFYLVATKIIEWLQGFKTEAAKEGK